ncbi:MAG: sugar transferase [Chloroflexota bacterium]|nr:sugar transferase [Chloroflexota bacterium]
MSDHEVGSQLNHRIDTKKRRFRQFFALVGTLAFSFFAWILPETELLPHLWIAAVMAFGLHLMLTLAILEWAHILPVSQAWVYRLAFLLSAGLAFLGWILLPTTHTAEYMFAGFMGAFVGAFIKTTLDLGLLEKSMMPSPDIPETVFRCHFELIGEPKPGPLSKSVFNYIFAVLGLLVFSPVLAACICLVWFEDPGPIFFIKYSVGKGGRTFQQYKIRTMLCGAEEHIGLVFTHSNDSRSLIIGRFLRKTGLDELPQLVNILLGDMGFVGPRPLRTVLVHEFMQEIPEFVQRHRVLPGITGLAQAACDHELTPRQKLRLDLLYIRYASVGFDLKLILLTGLVVLFLRWKPDWDGRIPPRWIRWGSRD